MTGRFSKDLPTRLAADYHAALADPDLIALRDQLALCDARISDLVRRVDTGEAGAHWRMAQRAVSDFRTAQRANDAPAAATALRVLEQTVSEGVTDHAAWEELLKTIEARRRLADTERRRLEAIDQSITKGQALLLVAALTDAVRRHVSDRRTLGSIGVEFARIVDGSNAGGR